MFAAVGVHASGVRGDPPRSATRYQLSGMQRVRGAVVGVA